MYFFYITDETFDKGLRITELTQVLTPVITVC